MTYALFADAFAAYRTVEALRSLGVSDSELSLVSRQEIDAADDGAVRTDGPAPTTRPIHEPEGTMNHGAKNAAGAAVGMGLGAVVAGVVVPPAGIILGAGALAAALSAMAMNKAAQGHAPSPIESALRERRVSDEAISTIVESLDSSGALLQIDHRDPDAQPTEAQILQLVSDHGGRVVWGAEELAEPGRDSIAPGP